MQCIHCGTEMDELETICPKCGRGQYRAKEINFGDIADTDYGNADLLFEEKEEKQETEEEIEKINVTKIIFLVIVFSIICGGTYFAYNVLSSKSKSNSSIVKIDNFLNDITREKSGTINIKIKKNDIQTELKGKFEANLDLPYLNIELTKEATDEIIVGSEELKMNILLNDLGLYENSTATGILTYFKKINFPEIKSFLIEKNIKNQNSEDLKLNFYGNTLEVFKKSFDVEDLTVSVYYDENNLYRISISKIGENLVVDLDRDKYYYTYYKNDENIVSGEFKVRKTVKGRTYDLTIDTKNDLRDIIVELEYDSNNFQEKKYDISEDIDTLPVINQEDIKSRIRDFLGF